MRRNPLARDGGDFAGGRSRIGDFLRFFDHAPNVTDDDGNVTGSRRFHAKVGVAMIVQAAFATRLAAAPRREGTLRKMTLGPIAKALPEQLKTA